MSNPHHGGAKILRLSGVPCLPCLFGLLCFLAVQIPVLAQEHSDPQAEELAAKLDRGLTDLAGGFDGVVGVFARDLATGRTFALNADMVFPQASTIKIAILIELLRQAQAGELALTERIAVPKAKMVPGSGTLQHFGDGTSQLSLRDLAVLMVVDSDNTATNILIERVGMERVNRMLRGHGMTQTLLARQMFDMEGFRAGRDNLSTPREMATLVERLWRGEILDPAHRDLALEILSYYKDTPLRRGVPGRVRVAHKPGWRTGVRVDAGLVLIEGRPYSIAVMTTFNASAEEAATLVEEVSRRVFSYFDRVARSNRWGARDAP